MVPHRRSLMSAFEKIGEILAGDGDKVLVVAAAPYEDRRSRLVASVQAWDEGGLLYENEVVLPLEKSRGRYACDAEKRVGVPAEIIAAALLRLSAKLQEYICTAQDQRTKGSKVNRTQQSLEAPGMVCVADAGGAHVYIIRNIDGTLTVQSQVAGDYRGEQVDHVPPVQVPWMLPQVAEVLKYANLVGERGWRAMLLTDLEQWHRDASDLGREEAYLLLALYDLLTYITEFTDYLAIILLEAEPERGKSRTGQAWAAVARHGTWLQGIREANLLRAASDRQAALFIDVMDLWKKAELNHCEDIILGRWERGGTVERVQYPDKGAFADTVSYSVFGPTMAATNEKIHRILDTRCLRIDMPLSAKRYSGRVQPIEARPLIERLMAWRGWMLGQSLPDSGPPADGRLGDILRPLKQVLQMVAPERMQEFDVIVQWQSTRRRDDLAGGVEADVVRAVMEAERTITGGYLPLSNVLTMFNATRPADWQRTGRWLAGKLRKLGWPIKRIGHDNTYMLAWDENLLERLSVKHGVDEKVDIHAPAKYASHQSHPHYFAPLDDEDATDATGATQPLEIYVNDLLEGSL